MGVGSVSLPHQHWQRSGLSSKAELQPGQRQPSVWFERGFSRRSWSCFARHLTEQWRWVTTQQTGQDHTLLDGRTSLVQITHSYWPFTMSSWIRVPRSAAVDLGGGAGALGGWRCLGLWCLSALVPADGRKPTNLEGRTGWPGINSGAVALSPLPVKEEDEGGAVCGRGPRPPPCETTTDCWPPPPRPPP
jgi:hypothetical protein